MNFFYENITLIPYIAFIGIKWCCCCKQNEWDSNESAKYELDQFFCYMKEGEMTSCSNGFPIYQLFNYLSFQTPNKIRNKLNFLIVLGFGINCDWINENDFELFCLLFEHSNKIFQEHRKKLKLKGLYSKEKWFWKWDEHYKNFETNTKKSKKIWNLYLKIYLFINKIY